MGEPTPVSSGPGAAREGAARRGGGSGVRGRVGAASFTEEAGNDRAVGTRGGLEPGSIGMRQALSEVLECASPAAGAGGQGLPLPTDWEADVG